jgi:hypothetical protein
MTITLQCHGVTARWHCRHWLPRLLVALGGKSYIVLFGRVLTSKSADVVRRAHRMRRPIIKHEHAHVRQWRNYGWRFPFAYVWAWIAAGFSYRNNRFEIEAREAEGRPEDEEC